MNRADTRASFRTVLAKQFQGAYQPPSKPAHLTVQQYELLAKLYFETHRFEVSAKHEKQLEKPDHILRELFPEATRINGVLVNRYRSHAVLWSPKALLGRSPTKAESASYSRAVKKLLERRLITKEQRYVTITEAGKEALRVYEDEHFGENTYISDLLEHDAFRRDLELIGRAANLAKQYGMTELLEDKPGTLPDLLVARLGIGDG